MHAEVTFVLNLGPDILTPEPLSFQPQILAPVVVRGRGEMKVPDVEGFRGSGFSMFCA